MATHSIKEGSGVEDHKKHAPKKSIGTLKRVIQAFYPYKVQVALILLVILLSVILGLVNPLIVRLIFDDAIARHDLQLLIVLVLIMMVIPVITGVVGVGQTYLSNIVGQRVMRDFRNRLYSHLQRMSLRFFTSTHTGEIQSRLSNDVGGAQVVVTDTVTRLLTNISIVLSTIVVMVYISPLLTLITLGILPLFLWITYKVGMVGRLTRKQTQQSMAALSTLMQETLSVSGMLLIKSFGRQKYAQEQFEMENQNLTDLSVRQQLIGRWFFMCVNIVFAIAPAIVYLVAGWQIIHNTLHADITIGGIVAFTTLQSRLFAPIGQLLNAQVEIQGTLGLFDRIFEYLDLPVEIQDIPDTLHLSSDDVRGHVAFKDVSFTYKRDEVEIINKVVGKEGNSNGQAKLPFSEETSLLVEDLTTRATLNHISFEILPGQLAALVGPSGAGKTTITYLLPRHYDADCGVIEIDGHPIKDIALASLGEIIGIVTQETYLFHASIKKNLLYARPDASDEEIMEAAKAAAIHDHIMELSEGYETVVGERGYKLSGGEKQRLAIARVILKNPRILILDEATSSLDTHSERLIQAALEPLMKNRTTLAIAHRLSTILAADVILVVDKGEIVERGTHNTLLEMGGFYARLYHEQFSQQLQEQATV